MVTSWLPAVATLPTTCREWLGEQGPALRPGGAETAGGGVSLPSSPNPAWPCRTTSRPLKPSRGPAPAQTPSRAPPLDLSQSGPLLGRPSAPAPRSQLGCAGGHSSSNLTPAGLEASGPTEGADGAEREHPRGSRSGGSGLMVTLRGVVHCSEPWTSPCPPLVRAQPGFSDWALQRGASPQAPAMYKREPTPSPPAASPWARAAGVQPHTVLHSRAPAYQGPAQPGPHQDPRPLH